MPERKAFLLRIDPAVLDALQRDGRAVGANTTRVAPPAGTEEPSS